MTVGIDGGYVRYWEEKPQHFEVIGGKSSLAFRRADKEEIPLSKCFRCVQTLDTKPKRRLFEVLHSHGHHINQQITFLSDGWATVRELQLDLSAHAEHLIDWSHLAMRPTVLQQTAKGLLQMTSDGEEDYPPRNPVVRDFELLKWYLWHGNVYKALQVVQSVEMDLEAAVATRCHGTTRKRLKAMEEFHTYIENYPGFIPNDGKHYRYAERISIGFVESAVNQVISKPFCKRQPMQWTTRGVHLLLQTWVKTLN
jgi:hypothetical protein